MRKIFPTEALAALALFPLAFASGPAQKPETDGATFTVQSQLVEIFLTVTKNNQLVPNLEMSDFQLAEDGTAAPIDRLDHRDAPLQIVLLVDISESVSANLKYIQDAASAFIESLNPQDRVMLVFFNSEIRVYPQIAESRTPLFAAIRSARAEGATRLYDALLLAIRHLDGKSGRKAIVCFTDGQDTSGTTARTTALNAAARFGCPVYTIGAGAGLEMDSLKIILRDFAEPGGGKAFFIQSLRKLREAFEQVARELHSGYVLSYYTRIPPDDKWHKLSVTSADPEHKIHARKGFFAAKKQAFLKSPQQTRAKIEAALNPD